MWIGLTGYARTGKDTVARLLQELEPRFTVVSMGNLIKASADPVLQEYLGISAYTENPKEKEIIRSFLVWHGYHKYDEFLGRFKAVCQGKEYLINTRVFDLREAKWWVDQGGVLIEVQRPGFGPVEPTEERNLKRLKEAGLVHATLLNDGDLDKLRERVRALWQALLMVEAA